MPLKLRKAEYSDVGYKVFTNPDILAIKKRFTFPCKIHDTDEDITHCEFTVVRLFKMV
jgi:hypothetical protein